MREACNHCFECPNTKFSIRQVDVPLDQMPPETVSLYQKAEAPLPSFQKIELRVFNPKCLLDVTIESKAWPNLDFFPPLGEVEKYVEQRGLWLCLKQQVQRARNSYFGYHSGNLVCTDFELFDQINKLGGNL